MARGLGLATAYNNIQSVKVHFYQNAHIFEPVIFGWEQIYSVPSDLNCLFVMNFCIFNF